MSVPAVTKLNANDITVEYEACIGIRGTAEGGTLTADEMSALEAALEGLNRVYNTDEEEASEPGDSEYPHHAIYDANQGIEVVVRYDQPTQLLRCLVALFDHEMLTQEALDKFIADHFNLLLGGKEEYEGIDEAKVAKIIGAIRLGDDYIDVLLDAMAVWGLNTLDGYEGGIKSDAIRSSLFEALEFELREAGHTRADLAAHEAAVANQGENLALTD
jgi:hypothetical protein